MLNNKLFRHTLSLVLLVLASAMLFPAAQAGSTLTIWGLVAIAVIANLINLVVS
jgi:hypothetical protein